MPITAYKNFLAGANKRNMLSFALFPANRDLSWIFDNPSLETVATVAYSATPTFDIANGGIQRITLTGNVTSSTFTYNGGSSIPDATDFFLQIIQDATGSRTFAWPASVRNNSGLPHSGPASTMTTYYLIYRNSGWDFALAPMEGPST